jgi:pyruvate/2-oxoacid:ferredoxin oxidoreductase beta subunit
MTNTNTMAVQDEIVHPGHLACPGCGASIAVRFALQALGRKTMLVIPACCYAVIAGAHPQTSLDIPVLHTAFATAGAAASGLRAALDARGDRETTVVAWAGDGGTFDIGLQALSGAVERNEDFIFVCYDNEAYMNTGVQRSSSTPFGTRTTTTPGEGWKNTRKKNIVEILAAHRIPYAATASIAYPQDLIRKFQKAKEMKGGSRFIHIFATCPTGWRSPSEQSVKIARLAVQTGVFPLYEVTGGVAYTLNEMGNRPVAEYMATQGRFHHLTDADIQTIQAMVDADAGFLRRKMES